MGNFEVIVEKLLKLQEYIDQIEKIKPSRYENYISEITVKYAVERIMQLIEDIALDINNILLAYNNKPPAPDYYNSFIEVAECGIFDSICYACDIIQERLAVKSPYRIIFTA